MKDKIFGNVKHVVEAKFKHNDVPSWVAPAAKRRPIPQKQPTQLAPIESVSSESSSSSSCPSVTNPTPTVELKPTHGISNTAAYKIKAMAA